MKTLEERAHSTTQWLLHREGLLKAANIRQIIQNDLEEQRNIDIDKACFTYCRFCPHQCENYPHKDCSLQIEFRKALEE